MSSDHLIPDIDIAKVLSVIVIWRMCYHINVSKSFCFLDTFYTYRFNWNTSLIDCSGSQDPSDISWINCYGFLSDENTKKKIFSVWRFPVLRWLVMAGGEEKTTNSPKCSYSISLLIFFFSFHLSPYLGVIFYFADFCYFIPPISERKRRNKKKQNK